MTKILLEKKIDQMTLKLKKDQNYHKTQKNDQNNNET